MDKPEKKPRPGVVIAPRPAQKGISKPPRGVMSKVQARERPAVLPVPANRNISALTRPSVFDRWVQDAAGVRAVSSGDNVITMFDVVGDDPWSGGGITAKSVTAQSISKSLHLHGIFGSIIQDLIDMAIKQALIRPLANSFFGGSGGGGGGLFGSIAKLFGGAEDPLAGVEARASSFYIPGLASGGSFVVGGNSGIDKNILSINGEPTVRIGSGETIAVIPPTIPSARRIGQATRRRSISRPLPCRTRR